MAGFEIRDVHLPLLFVKIILSWMNETILRLMETIMVRYADLPSSQTVPGNCCFHGLQTNSQAVCAKSVVEDDGYGVLGHVEPQSVTRAPPKHVSWQWYWVSWLRQEPMQASAKYNNNLPLRTGFHQSSRVFFTLSEAMGNRADFPFEVVRNRFSL